MLEKAYLKVRGGYDFPGSNSGTDLWVLTGWIPEQVFLQRSVYASLLSFNINNQHVVVTMFRPSSSGIESTKLSDMVML